MLHTIALIYGHVKKAAVAAGMAVIGAIQSILGWLGFAVTKGDSLQDTFVSVFLAISESVSNFVLNAVEWIQVFVTNWRLTWDLVKSLALAGLKYLKGVWDTYWGDVLPARLKVTVMLMGEIFMKLFTDVLPTALYAGIRIWWKMFKNFYTKVLPMLVGAGLSKLTDLWIEWSPVLIDIFGVIMEAIGNFFAEIKKMIMNPLDWGGSMEESVAAMKDEMNKGLADMKNNFDKGLLGDLPSFGDLFELGPEDIAAAKAAGDALVAAMDINNYSQATQDAVTAYNAALKKMVTPGADAKAAWEEAMAIYRQLQGFKDMRALDRAPMTEEEIAKENAKKDEAGGALANKIGEALIKAGTRIGIGDLGKKIQDAMFQAQKDAKAEAKEKAAADRDIHRNQALDKIADKIPGPALAGP